VIPKRWIEVYLHFLLRYRAAVALFVGVATLGFLVSLPGLKVHTDFFDFYPPDHPYVRMYREFRRMFGSANVLTVILEVQEGDIYNPDTLQRLDRMTKYVIESRGVIPYQILSIAHPRVKSITTYAGAIQVRPVFHPGVPKTREMPSASSSPSTRREAFAACWSPSTIARPRSMRASGRRRSISTTCTRGSRRSRRRRRKTARTVSTSLGLLVEIRTPGFAMPGAIGLLSLGLFFWGHWIVQLAGWEELLLVSIGVLLLALEVFVLPGITVAGIAGIVALVAGLGMTLVGAGATVPVIITALGRVAISILLAMASAFALFRVLPRLPFGRRLVLETGMQADLGYVSTPDRDRDWLGRTGTVLAPLRPAGIAEIDGARIDVVSEGGFIEAGTPITVIRVDGNRIVVRPLPPRQQPPHD
jgi:hypothetical protein